MFGMCCFTSCFISFPGFGLMHIDVKMNQSLGEKKKKKEKTARERDGPEPEDLHYPNTGLRKSFL